MKTKIREHKHYRNYCQSKPAVGEYIITAWFDGEPEIYVTNNVTQALQELTAYYIEDWDNTGRTIEFDVARLESKQAVSMDPHVRRVLAKDTATAARKAKLPTLHTKFHVKKGRSEIPALTTYSGILGAYLNPFGEGPDIVEIVHLHNPDTLAEWIKDQSCGEILLVPLDQRVPIERKT